MKKLLPVIAIAVLILGCTKQQEETTDESQPRDGEQQPTSKTSESEDAVQSVIEDATGVSAVRKGEKAKDRIKAIQEERQRQIEEYID
ncbi:MAG: hypothetical protein K9N51_10140 [Candidatus Pacebacteria bacterium]|nr:hypothetical protein [Candidatus Paceibacterota bacterium]